MLSNEGGVQSTVNTTTVTLAANGTFTGTYEQNSRQDVMVSCFSNTEGVLYLDFSVDGVNANVFPPNGFHVTAGVHEFHVAIKGPRYFRARFVNSNNVQSTFRLYTYYGNFRTPNSPLNAILAEDADAISVRSITEETMIAEGKYEGRRIINKFGRNPDVDAAADIWDGGSDYTGFPTAAAEEFSVLSTSTSDTSAGTGARTVRIFYMDANKVSFDSSGNPLYVDITMNGLTPVNTGITGMRVYRFVVLTAGSTGSNVGDLIVRWRTTTTTVFCRMLAGLGQCQVAVYTIPSGYTGYVISYESSIIDTNANSAQVAIWAREEGGAVRLLRPFAVNTGSTSTHDIYGGLMFPEKTDLKLRVLSIANTNANVTGSMDLRIVRN